MKLSNEQIEVINQIIRNYCVFTSICNNEEMRLLLTGENRDISEDGFMKKLNELNSKLANLD